MSIRVRFAPSPTGYLHVGGARTAIFNWLFARKHSGQFFLRIEDTDVARSGQDMVQALFDALTWLGVDWDEEPVFQSTRFHIYKLFAERLLEESQAYRCFCTAERLQNMREAAREEGRPLKYDRHCLRLSQDDVESRLRAGTPFAIRFKVGEGATEFRDEVYGKVRFENEQLEDFVLLRSDGVPTYHLAVVVDDKEMDISHVIRGDDHLSNTPKHVLLYEAFGWQKPVFAHVPLILGPDRQRLSKRHGATSVNDYQKNGYLPDAVFNFLTLLGWSSGDDRELFSRDELLREFDLSGSSKKSAVFDERKLEWMNAQYLHAMEEDALLDQVLPYAIEAGVVSAEWARDHRDYLVKIIGLLKPRMRRLTDFAEMSHYFFKTPESYDAKGVEKHWKDERIVDRLKAVIERLAQIRDFGHQQVEDAVRELAEEEGVSAAKLIHPMRLALTGMTASPGLFEIMEILGQETVLGRLRKAVEYIRTVLWNEES